jgi:hypothetical protein
VVVVINFSSKTEKVDIRKGLSNLPDVMKVAVVAKSQHKEGDDVNINEEIELQPYESIVAHYYYNSSAVLAINRLTLMTLVITFCTRVVKL